MELRYLDSVRSDIKFTTSHLTTNKSTPTVAFAKESKQLLSYLHGTQNLSIRICLNTDQIMLFTLEVALTTDWLYVSTNTATVFMPSPEP